MLHLDWMIAEYPNHPRRGHYRLHIPQFCYCHGSVRRINCGAKKRRKKDDVILIFKHAYGSEGKQMFQWRVAGVSGKP
jgi:hypothetical protein